jgi:hypothetical protein
LLKIIVFILTSLELFEPSPKMMMDGLLLVLRVPEKLTAGSIRDGISKSLVLIRL